MVITFHITREVRLGLTHVIGAKFAEVTPRTITGVLAAVKQAGGEVPCYRYHKHHTKGERPKVGHLSNFRLYKKTIIADLETCSECPLEIVEKLILATELRPESMGLSITPKAARKEGWELLIDSLESIDLCDEGCASPGGLRPPTEQQVFEYKIRAAREFDAARAYFAEKAS